MMHGILLLCFGSVSLDLSGFLKMTKNVKYYDAWYFASLFWIGELGFIRFLKMIKNVVYLKTVGASLECFLLLHC